VFSAKCGSSLFNLRDFNCLNTLNEAFHVLQTQEVLIRGSELYTDSTATVDVSYYSTVSARTLHVTSVKVTNYVLALSLDVCNDRYTKADCIMFSYNQSYFLVFTSKFTNVKLSRAFI
jgi:hypothetical protein